MGCLKLENIENHTLLRIVKGGGIPNLHTATSDYRFGYNGMEKDKEIKGDGNSYTTEFRQYDPRLGRWLSLDPLMAEYSEWSPYVAFENNPVLYVDPEGLEATNPDEGKVLDEVVITAKRKDSGSSNSSNTRNNSFDNFDYNGKGQALSSVMKMTNSDHSSNTNNFSTKGSFSNGQKTENNNFDGDPPPITGEEEEGEYSEDGNWIFEDGEWHPISTIEEVIIVMPQNSFLVPIGKWVLKKALKPVAKWIAKKWKKWWSKGSKNKCFVAGTLIHTKDGLVPIEQLSVGDSVWSYNEFTGKKELKAIETYFVSTSDHLRGIVIESDTILTTDEHPFYVNNHFLEAKFIKVGDTLSLANGQLITVKDVFKRDTTVTVYNFEVSDLHTYYVSYDGVLVHNKGKIRKKIKKKKEYKSKEAEHTSGKRKSTEGKHQKGQTRKGKDKGGEKKDKNMPYRNK